VKTVHFIMEVQQALLAYLREERPAHDPLGRTRLSALSDDDPFFLTEDGTPYTRTAFMRHWRKVYPIARKRRPIPFSPHTIRHLVVTELLLEARGRCDKTSAAYLDLKLAIAAMMGWRSPQTIDVYDHSLDRLEALGVLRALQESLRDRGHPRLRAQGGRLGGPVQSALPRDVGAAAVAGPMDDGVPAALHMWFADRITGRSGL
jgi:integrase